MAVLLGVHWEGQRSCANSEVWSFLKHGGDVRALQEHGQEETSTGLAEEGGSLTA